MTGERKTRWKWRRPWNEEGWKESHAKVVVHERMSKGEKVKCPKEKKKVKGWSTEEMKDKANSRFKLDTEEMIKWRGLSQEEVEQCWKNLADKLWLKFWTSRRSRIVKERPSEAEAFRWSGGRCAEARNTE